MHEKNAYAYHIKRKKQICVLRRPGSVLKPKPKPRFLGETEPKPKPSF